MSLLLLVLLLAGASAAQAGRLAGTVVDAAGEPVKGAYVQANTAVATDAHGRSGTMPEVLAQAKSDGNGRYSFDAPAGLFTLSVAARGYYVLSAGGIDSDTITHSCPPQGDCGEIQFKLGKPGVVEGWLSDRFGDPVWSVMLALRPAGAAPGFRSRGARPGTYGWGASDDRGYFRIWNIRPGRYVLESDHEMRRGQNFQLTPQEIEIGEQGKTVELHVSVGSNDGLHTISGIVEGLAEKGMYAGIGVQPQASEQNDVSWGRLLAGGQFSVGGLKTGDYVVRLIIPDKQGGQMQFRMLAELHVDRDITDLHLTPQPGAAIQLAAKFKDMAQRNVGIYLRPVNGAGIAEQLRLQAPDYEATRSGLVAGEYEVLLYDEDCYLAEPYRVALRYGQTATLTVEIGNAFAALHGRVRVAEGAQRDGASHFTVGARGPQTSYKTQADDAGRFSFAKLPPGSYKIAAWPKPDIDPNDDAVWGGAKGVANIEIEAGFDVEVELTATP